MDTVHAASDTLELIPLADWRDVTTGLELVAAGLVFAAIFAIFIPWTLFRLSWRSAMGLVFAFGLPAAVAAWGIHRAWYRGRWYITSDGATVVWRRRGWKGETEERFATGQYVFELSREVGQVGTVLYPALCLTMRPRDGPSRGLVVKYGRAKAGDVMTVVSALRDRGVDVVEPPGKW